jgi:cytochrome c
MTPNPQLSTDDATKMIQYILSLDEQPAVTENLPVHGSFTPKLAEGHTGESIFLLRAKYTDKGSDGIPPATSVEILVLRSPLFPPGNSDWEEEIRRFSFSGSAEMIIPVESGAFLGYKQIDLSNIGSIEFGVSASTRFSRGGKIEIRIASAEGTLLGETPMIVPSEGRGFSAAQNVTADIIPTEGVHDL